VIEIGVDDVVRAYIDKKIDDVSSLLLKSMLDEFAYAIARIRGVISDAEDRMTPEEFRNARDDKQNSKSQVSKLNTGE
jgi:hypothetical protein